MKLGVVAAGGAGIVDCVFGGGEGGRERERVSRMDVKSPRKENIYSCIVLGIHFTEEGGEIALLLQSKSHHEHVSRLCFCC